MKRVISIALLLVMALCMLTSCGASGEQSSDEPIKIGVSIWGVTDNQGALCKKYLDYAADALGIELVYALNASEADGVVNSMNNLIQAGCQGIIVCNYSDGELVSSIDVCEEAGVYLSQFFRTVSDPEMKAYALWYTYRERGKLWKTVGFLYKERKNNTQQHEINDWMEDMRASGWQ